MWTYSGFRCFSNTLLAFVPTKFLQHTTKVLSQLIIKCFLSILQYPHDVVIADEAQEMETCCLNELRLLRIERFDLRCLLATVLSGDMRLPELFRNEALISLGSRIKLRLLLEPYDRTILFDYLEHGLAQASAPHLMTSQLKETLADHAAGNLRILNNMATELLARGIRDEVAQLDEKLFIELYARQPAGKRRKAAAPALQ